MRMLFVFDSNFTIHVFLFIGPVAAKRLLGYIYIYGAGALRGAWGNERPGFRHLVPDLFCLRLYGNKKANLFY